MDNSGIKLDQALIEEKTMAIADIIDGLTLPHAICILGSVIVELVMSSRRQGFDVVAVISDWLRLLRNNVENLQIDDKELVN